MAEKRRGCGCCGPGTGCLLLFILAGILIGLVYWSYTKIQSWSGPTAAALPAPFAADTNYEPARRKLDQFLNNSNERAITLSSGEVTTLLNEAPEFGFLGGRLVAVFHEDQVEVSGSLPVKSFFAAKRYLNFVLFMRPSIRNGRVSLNIYRIDRDGRSIPSKDLAEFRDRAQPWIEETLSLLNRFRGHRGIRELEVENSGLILAR